MNKNNNTNKPGRVGRVGRVGRAGRAGQNKRRANSTRNRMVVSLARNKIFVVTGYVAFGFMLAIVIMALIIK